MMHHTTCTIPFQNPRSFHALLQCDSLVFYKRKPRGHCLPQGVQNTSAQCFIHGTSLLSKTGANITTSKSLMSWVLPLSGMIIPFIKMIFHSSCNHMRCYCLRSITCSIQMQRTGLPCLCLQTSFHWPDCYSISLPHELKNQSLYKNFSNVNSEDNRRIHYMEEEKKKINHQTHN